MEVGGVSILVDLISAEQASTTDAAKKSEHLVRKTHEILRYSDHYVRSCSYSLL